MKRSVQLIIILLFFSACQLKEQAEELYALKHCTYEVISADSVYLANIQVSDLITKEGIDLIRAPQLAFSYLQKKMPLHAVINIKIINSGIQEAAINQFGYKVLFKDTEITNGYFEKKISIPPDGGSVIMPVRLNQDIYALISDPVNQSAVSDFLGTGIEKYAKITIKIKPAIAAGTGMISYPGYIAIEKEFSNKALLSYFNNLDKQEDHIFTPEK